MVLLLLTITHRLKFTNLTLYSVRSPLQHQSPGTDFVGVSLNQVLILENVLLLYDVMIPTAILVRYANTVQRPANQPALNGSLTLQDIRAWPDPYCWPTAGVCYNSTAHMVDYALVRVGWEGSAVGVGTALLCSHLASDGMQRTTDFAASLGMRGKSKISETITVCCGEDLFQFMQQELLTCTQLPKAHAHSCAHITNLNSSALVVPELFELVCVRQAAYRVELEGQRINQGGVVWNVNVTAASKAFINASCLAQSSVGVKIHMHRPGCMQFVCNGVSMLGRPGCISSSLTCLSSCAFFAREAAVRELSMVGISQSSHLSGPGPPLHFGVHAHP